jgi:hypothetical protein
MIWTYFERGLWDYRIGGLGLGDWGSSLKNVVSHDLRRFGDVLSLWEDVLAQWKDVLA